MHVILLIILALSGLMWGIVNLQRELRRREWAAKNTTPLFSIESPRELAATLAFAALACGGELTSDQKQALIQLYEDELNFSSDGANEMYAYASYLISTDPNYATRVRQIVAPVLEELTSQQCVSTLDMVQNLVAEPTVTQLEFISQLKAVLVNKSN